MKLIVAALTALHAAEARLFELVNPAETIAGHVKDLAKAAAEHVRSMEDRLASAEAQVKQLHAALQAAGIPVPEFVAEDPAIAAAVEEKRAELEQVPPAPPVVPIAIPLSPELQSAIDAAPAT